MVITEVKLKQNGKINKQTNNYTNKKMDSFFIPNDIIKKKK